MSFDRALRLLGFAPALSSAWETVGRMERGSHRYRATVDRSGSMSLEIFASPISAEVHFTRWPDGTTSLSGEARWEPRS